MNFQDWEALVELGITGIGLGKIYRIARFFAMGNQEIGRIVEESWISGYWKSLNVEISEKQAKSNRYILN